MSKSDRIVNLLCLLAAKPGLTIREMAEELETTERSIYRYLSNLRKNGYSLYKYDDPRSSLHRYKIAPLKLSAGEAVALVNACQPFLDQKGLPLSDELEDALGKIKAAICHQEERERFYKTQPLYKYLSPHFKDYTSWNDIITAIEECMRERIIANVVYHSYNGKITNNRKINPYSLFWHEGNLYLAAYCQMREKMRSFRIDRFLSFEKTKRKFLRDSAFNLDDYFEGSWKIYRGMEQVKLKILVYPPSSRLFKESAYHDTQQNKELEDGKLECTYKVYDTPELRSWLLSWGSRIVIREPEELRNQIKEELQAGLQNYT